MMNVKHEETTIGYIFKPTKQPNYTHEENMAYIQKFIEEVNHALPRRSGIHEE